jgi:hypothetical protein
MIRGWVRILLSKGKERKRRMKLKNKNIVGAVLIVVALVLIPLIVSARKYEIGLNTYSWFSNTTASYDFFLYWKGQALILLCGVISLYIAVKLFSGRENLFGKMDWRILLCLAVYFLMCAISTIFSEHRETAVWGGYEQWEGLITLGTYVLVFFFAYLLLKGETEIRIVAVGLLAGAFLMSLLSVFQAAGQDFFRTENGQAAMNFMLDKKLKFTFNFEIGRVYATLYNPNYVGSYVALVLPVVLSLVCIRKKVSAVLRSLVSVVTAVFLVIMLFGSESVTGFIGIVASLVLFVVCMLTNIKKHPKIAVGTVVVCAALLVTAVMLNRPIFEYGITKITNPTKNSFKIESMTEQDGVLSIQTVEEDVLRMAVYIQNGSYMYEAVDSDGNSAGIYRDEESGSMKFTDERFQGIEISEASVNAEERDWNGIVIKTPATGKSYTLVLDNETCEDGKVQTEYQIYNPFGKLDGMREIKTFGFADNLHFASRRGYIWSRTLPLLSEHILLGSGPNTFVYEFPNDDYIGMKNVGYDGAIVTKPHNMFLQIFVQTGLISLLAYLCLYGFYFVECLRLYWRKTEYTAMERLGIGLLLGTFGYLVTGLANDSTVAVAPVFWCLLGVGMAVNRFNRRAGQSA